MSNYAEKIALLLRKAEAKGTTPEEAEAYSQKAERLMIKWGISEAVARKAAGEDVPREKVIEIRRTCVGTYHAGEFKIGENIAYGLGNLRVLQSKGRGQRSTIYIIGHESDVHRWEILFTSLSLQAHSACAKWVRDERKAGRWSDSWWAEQLTPYGSYGPDFKATTETFPTVGQIHHEKFKARRQFLISFAHAVRYRLESMHRETVAETTGAELALRDRSTLVDDWMNEKYPSLGKSRGRGIGWNYHGADAGQRAGRNASLGENNLPGARKGLER